jgi:ectoine hydroxylase-related dioxygenase (phytanoyl-CoA dioxygenase family)
MSGITLSHATRFLSAETCDLDEFIRIVTEPTDAADYPNAESIEQGVVVYDGSAVRAALAGEENMRPTLLSEVASALLHGPGIVVFTDAVDIAAVDAATARFDETIEAEKQAGQAAGDHFAKPGANDRVWNALEKLALLAPETFSTYYRSEILAFACEAWLGPAYQVTSQVNVVNPGGAAQEAHRDYHLGFMTNEEAERFPSHVQRLSPLLTLQGAIAHCDMPVETGPTMYLPHSQKYEAGYLAYRRQDFVDYFAEHRVQLPLNKGDAIFFNPAVFHAAGHNRTTDVRRMANLLQISSCMGRSLERVDRLNMCFALYPTLVKELAAGVPADAVGRVVAASAEGYAFPTSLDHDQPVDGLTPPSQADVVSQALAEGWSEDALRTQLTEQNRFRAS